MLELCGPNCCDCSSLYLIPKVPQFEQLKTKPLVEIGKVILDEVADDRVIVNDLLRSSASDSAELVGQVIAILNRSDQLTIAPLQKRSFSKTRLQSCDSGQY